MIFGVLFSKPDSVQNPFAIFCIFCISTLIKETKLSLKFVCVAKIKFINCKIYLFHNLFVSNDMTAINMNFSPFFYSDHRDTGGNAAAGAEPGARECAFLELPEQPEAAWLRDAALYGCEWRAAAADEADRERQRRMVDRVPDRQPDDHRRRNGLSIRKNRDDQLEKCSGNRCLHRQREFRVAALCAERILRAL